MLVAKILNFNIHNRKSCRFCCVDIKDGFGPGTLFVFAIILADSVLCLPTVSDLHVIPGHEGDGIPGVIPGVKEGHGALAVEGDSLFCSGRLKLQMVKLVAVSLVVDIKGVVLVVSDPHLLLVRHDGDFLRHRRFGIDASSSSIHVAVNENRVFLVISIGINPILSTGLQREGWHS